MKKLLTFGFLLFLLTASTGAINLSKLDKCNVVWTIQSDSAKGSMPIGNGKIGLNVWVEKNGDLVFLISHTDAFDENSINMKIGRIRVTLNPNPFIAGNYFKQELVLKEGAMYITGGSGATSIRLKLWVDANSQVIRVESASETNFTQIVRLETWRDTKKLFTNTQVSDMFHSFSGTNPYQTYIYPDTLEKVGSNGLRWFHYNQNLAQDPVAINLALQDLQGFAPQMVHPLQGRIFGAMLTGNNYALASNGSMAIASISPSKQNNFSIGVLTLHPSTPTNWRSEVTGIMDKAKTVNYDSTWIEHKKWWSDFWDRSWIFVDYAGKDLSQSKRVENLNQAYTLTRYLNACGGRGTLPIKFNGSIFSYGTATDPDYRRWGGPGFWYQNERLCYWNMLATGDFDLMQPWFNYFKNNLAIAKYRTQHYFGHEGAYFSETSTFWGTEVSAHYGWSPSATARNPQYLPTTTYVTRYWQGGIEQMLMMTEYYNYTKNQIFANEILLPHVEAITKFYDKHYDKRDINGKIIFDPAQSLETWHTAVNPMPEIAGLKYTLAKLLTINELGTADQRTLWQSILNKMPEIPTLQLDGMKMLAAGDSYSNSKNIENPEMYGVFPYKVFGIGKPNIDWAKNAQKVRRYPGWTCWFQDNEQYALLGNTKKSVDYILLRADTICHSSSRFPAFWNSSYDWIPDIDHGGNLLLSLQLMLMQTEGAKITMLPAWPKEWNVDFKLKAPDNTTLEGTCTEGTLTLNSVLPETRRKDVEVLHPISIDSLNSKVFVPSTQQFTGAAEGSTLFFDFDSDGDKDLLYVDMSGSYLYINDGKGNFTKSSFNPFPSVTGGSIVAADFNKDGKDEVLIVGGLAGSAISKMYKQTVPGQWSEIANHGIPAIYSNSAADSRPNNSSVVAADFNGDGKMDVVVNGIQNSGVQIAGVYLNNGNGTFTLSTPFSTGFSAAGAGGVAVGDFNGDKIPDLNFWGWSSLTKGGLFETFRGGTTGYTKVPTVASCAFWASHNVFGDFDGDKIPEMAIVSWGSKVLRYKGNDVFEVSPYLKLENFQRVHAMAADIDLDGCDELIITGFNNNSTSSQVLYYDYDKENNDFSKIQIGNFGQMGCASLADVDGDGDLDLFAIGFDDNKVKCAKLFINTTPYPSFLANPKAISNDMVELGVNRYTNLNYIFAPNIIANITAASIRKDLNVLKKTIKSNTTDTLMLPSITSANRYLYLSLSSGYEFKIIDMLTQTTVETSTPQIQNNYSNKYFVYSRDRNIVVESLENASATIDIYNLFGQSVCKGNITESRKLFPVNRSGMYFVKIKRNNNDYIFKIMLF